MNDFLAANLSLSALIPVTSQTTQGNEKFLELFNDNNKVLLLVANL